MKIIISPAKSLDFENKAPTNQCSQPSFIEKSISLQTKLKTFSREELGSLMKISPALADLNYHRNQNWQPPFSIKNAKQAVFAFTGEVFRGIDVRSIPESKIDLLQDRLRILSGLYGLLKPLDLIQAYRLEMGTRLKIESHQNLYQFWGEDIANALNDEMSDNELLINLASSEYFKAVPKKVLKVPMITPVFKELKNGAYKIVMTYAKKARGLMVRYILDNHINSLDELKGFNTEGYGFSEALSSETELVFTR